MHDCDGLQALTPLLPLQVIVCQLAKFLVNIGIRECRASLSPLLHRTSNLVRCSRPASLSRDIGMRGARRTAVVTQIVIRFWGRVNAGVIRFLDGPSAHCKISLI
jgi:hypothetical protein